MTSYPIGFGDLVVAQPKRQWLIVIAVRLAACMAAVDAIAVLVDPCQSTRLETRSFVHPVIRWHANTATATDARASGRNMAVIWEHVALRHTPQYTVGVLAIFAFRARVVKRIAQIARRRICLGLCRIRCALL